MSTIHRLDGCGSTPMAHYLKALAVLRLVSRQADSSARGFWQGDRFQLMTTLDKSDLERFFVETYTPTPMLDPWNGGSGFYPKDNKEGPSAILAGKASRFAPFRQALEQVAALVDGRATRPDGADKSKLLQSCRKNWNEGLLEWLNAAVVLLDDAEKYPALLGTGGNDGRLDFTNNFMKRLVELFDPDSGSPLRGTKGYVRASLWGTATTGLVKGKPIGQFFPGSAGGANSTAGFDGDSLINPFDFVLTLEGALVLQVAAVRRLDSSGLPLASAPFALRPQAVGYPSASSVDEQGRGEQWMPLWSGPATLGEVQALFREGRIQTGSNRAQSALEAARAVARLGAARGVSAFERFGYIERNGQANLAVPLGRWSVSPREHVDLLDEIAPWVDRLRRAAGSRGTPASFVTLLRTIESSMLAVCRQGDVRHRWSNLLMALADAEMAFVSRPRFTAEQRLSPIPRLSCGWYEAAYDDSAEMRLALAMARQTTPGDPRKLGPGLGPVRLNCLPLDPHRHTAFHFAGSSLAKDPVVVWKGHDPTQDLIALSQRRLIDAMRGSTRGFPLHGWDGAGLGDIELFLDGRVDLPRMTKLARALMALDPKGSINLRRNTGTAIPLHAVFRLLYMPHVANSSGQFQPIVPEVDTPLDPAPLRVLAAGRMNAALRLSLMRWRGAKARPKLRNAAGDRALARRIAASLAIPLAPADYRRLLDRIVALPSNEQDTKTLTTEASTTRA